MRTGIAACLPSTTCPRYVFISTQMIGRMVIGRLGKEPLIADSGDILELSAEDLALPAIQELLGYGKQGREDVARIEPVLIPGDVRENEILLVNA